MHTFKELSKALNVGQTTVYDWLKTMGKIQKLCKVIILHDNARPHVAKIVEEKLAQSVGGFTSPCLGACTPPSFIDIAPVYHLFQSMQYAFSDTHFRNFEEAD